MLEVPGPAEVILRAGAANGRPFCIAIQVELDLAFAPPIVVVTTPGEVGTNILALAVYAIY